MTASRDWVELFVQVQCEALAAELGEVTGTSEKEMRTYANEQLGLLRTLIEAERDKLKALVEAQAAIITELSQRVANVESMFAQPVAQPKQASIVNLARRRA
jgi:hypothetical protein